jgi:hypothetical protein
MATISELENLAEQMTQTLPPPERPQTKLNIMPGTGRWVIAKTGAGTYALRIEYTTAGGGTVTVRQQTELKGFADALAQAMRFAIEVATAHRHSWIAV